MKEKVIKISGKGVESETKLKIDDKSEETVCDELEPEFKLALFHWFSTRALFHTNLQRYRLQDIHSRDSLSSYHRVEHSGKDGREDEGATARSVQHSTGLRSSN